MSFYPAVEPNPDFARIEEKSLKYWDGEKTFEQSVQMRSAKNADGSNNEFIFYDGPPFANGLPHYGHLLTGFVKDLFARFQTMKGKRVERKFGWDCHGLPAEMGAEKELGISGRQQIAKYGIENFNNHCRTSVMKYASEWEYYVKRQGRWVDFVNDYKTMDSSFMESVMWAFKQLYDKGLMYEAYRVVPYSWAAETPLSNFETQLDNSYRDRADPAVTVAFKLSDGRKILAWTTTPWTLPSNLALAVGGGIKYRLINNEFIIGSFAAQKHAKDLLGEKWLPLPKGVKAAVESERLYMRPFEKSDYDSFKALMTDPEITRTLSDGAMEEAKIKSEFERFISDNKKNGYSQWAIFEKSTNQFIGRGGFDERDYVELHAEDEKGPELRLALVASAHGKGYGTELTKALMDYAFYTLKAERVIAGAHTSNPASNKLLSGMGFSNIKMAEYRNAEVNFYLFNNSKHIRPDEILGEKLSALSYTPLFPYFTKHPDSFRILIGDFVEEGAGTGIVHMAPGFGEDDQKLCEANGISLLVPVDGAGKYTDEIFDIDGISLKGRNVLECNTDIIKHLKATGNLIKSEQYIHSYPHCWRTDEPLIYKAVPSWYVEVTKFRHRMVELNKGINWIPGHVKEGLFGKWIENARDWSISRNRFWGAPIPVWKSDNPENKQLYVFGSIKELEEFFGTKVVDLHRPHIDNLTKPDPTNPAYTLRRVEDVLDCWFESGSMPYASQWADIARHKSGADVKTSDFRFPADFIVEYQAQTRGWFYTLMVLSTALFDKAPFTNCICHGVVLDDKGQKLSKRLNNYADPKWLFDTYGADALRWFMMSSPVMRGSEMYIDKEGKFIRDSVRLYIKPIWNAYSFFTLYANADGVQAEYNFDSANVLDKYIFGKLRQAVIKVDSALEAYDTIDACNAISAFFEVLNNWYIRRSRTRFWKDEKDADKLAAYNTLYTALHVMCRVAAPLLPMITEEIFKGLAGEGGASVHLTDYPFDVLNKVQINETLEQEMDLVRDVCNVAHSIRSSQNIRTRQPLAAISVAGKNVNSAFASLILEEVNVKELKEMPLQALQNYASYKLQLNMKKLGARLGEKFKEVLAASKSGAWKRLENSNIELAGVTISPDEFGLKLEPKDTNTCATLSSNDALVILDTAITPELEKEGIARDLVRMIQQARKDARLDVSDRIELAVRASDTVIVAFKEHRDYISEQTLTSKIHDSSEGKFDYTIENDFDDEKVTILLSRAA